MSEFAPKPTIEDERTPGEKETFILATIDDILAHCKTNHEIDMYVYKLYYKDKKITDDDAGIIIARLMDMGYLIRNNNPAA